MSSDMGNLRPVSEDRHHPDHGTHVEDADRVGGGRRSSSGIVTRFTLGIVYFGPVLDARLRPVLGFVPALVDSEALGFERPSELGTQKWGDNVTALVAPLVRAKENDGAIGERPAPERLVGRGRRGRTDIGRKRRGDERRRALCVHRDALRNLARASACSVSQVRVRTL
jgi:hypothetical protein